TGTSPTVTTGTTRDGGSELVGPISVVDGNINLAGTSSLSTTGVTMAGGSLTTGGAGTLNLGGKFTYNSRAHATVGSQVNLLAATRTIPVNDGPALNDLVISGQVTGLGGSAISKTGTATATLLLNNAANNYAGLSETQLITFGGTITGGTFALSFNGG